MYQRVTASRFPPPAWIVFIVLAGLFAAHVVAAYLPSLSTWGFLHGLSLSSLWQWAIWIIGLALIFPPMAAQCAPIFLRPPRVLATRGRAGRVMISILAAMALFAVLFALRSRAHIFGDGFRMLEGLANPDPSVLWTRIVLKEVLGIAWPWVNHHLWGRALGLPPALTYGLLNALAGVLLAFGLVHLIAALSPQRDRRILLCSAVLSSGTLLLGFGYVESYPWALSVATWALVYAVRSLRRPVLWRAALLLLMVSLAVHVLAVVFLPAVLWAGWRSRHPRSNRSILPFVLQTFAIAGILAVVGAFVVSRLIDVPLVVFSSHGQSTAYQLWSMTHLRDVANTLLLVAPAAVPLLLAAVARVKDNPPSAKNELEVIVVAAVAAWWASVVIDPSLGAMRDWDLLSFYGPFVALAATAVFLNFHARLARHGLAVITVQLCGLAIVHQVPWVALHQQGSRAVEIVDHVLADDPHLSGSYYQGTRALDFATWLLFGDDKRYDLATKYYQRRLAVVPDDAGSLWNLGTIYIERNLRDSAVIAYRKSLELDSVKDQRWFQFGALLYEQGEYGRAKLCMQRVLHRSPGIWEGVWALGKILTREGKYDSAAAMFLRAASLQPNNWGVRLECGQALMTSGDDSTALNELTAALRLRPREPLIRVRLAELSLFRKELREVRRVLQEWRQFAGSSAPEIEIWDSLTSLLPDSGLTDTMVARVFARLGNWYTDRQSFRLAADYFHRSARLHPNNSEYLTRAAEMYQHALSSPPDRTSPLGMSVKVSTERGRTDRR